MPCRLASGRLAWRVILSYSRAMKTAVSLPDELFDEIEVAARRMKLSRSGLLAKAAREFLAKHQTVNPTEAWNRAIEKGGQPGDDQAAKAFRRRTKQIIRRGN